MTLMGYALLAMALPHIAISQQSMVKMCLFYDRPSGHARSDPIISQSCSSSHVHTFYGPRSFHPNTSYDDLISTPSSMNTSPYVENKSLYWHPSIYRVDSVGEHVRVNDLEFGPYYRWDKSVSPGVEAFPPGFRMIAASNDDGACGYDAGDCEEDSFVAMFSECCDMSGEEESCSSWEGELFFPKQNCDFLGIALGEYTIESCDDLGWPLLLKLFFTIAFCLQQCPRAGMERLTRMITKATWHTPPTVK